MFLLRDGRARMPATVRHRIDDALPFDRYRRFGFQGKQLVDPRWITATWRASDDSGLY